MRRLLTLFLLVSTNIQTSLACGCINTTIEEAFKRSDLVVKGIVLAKRTITRDVSSSYIDSFQVMRDELYFKDQRILEYDILVEKTYKGKLTSDTLKLRTYLPSNCYLNLAVGSSYLVYAFRIPYQNNVYDNKIDSNTFHSSICSKTTKFELKEDRVLDKLRKN